MNYFEKILYFLQGTMNTPTAFGWFHLLCLTIMVLVIIFLYKIKNKNEKVLKIILATYGIIAFILELLKQLIWSFNYDVVTNVITWDFEWYAFPFQLCTTPIYVSLICLFLKNNNTRKALLSYIAYITILGSIATIIIPDSCFVSDILVNIHTMWLHLGSFVVSVYLFLSKEVELKFDNIKSAIKIFLIFVSLALIMNLLAYNFNIVNGETFNMFYISPYFISTLPVFDIIQQNVPYLIFLLIYIIAITIGALAIHYISLGMKYILKK